MKVNITLRTIVEQKWGDSYSEFAAKPHATVNVILEVVGNLLGENVNVRHALGRLLHSKREVLHASLDSEESDWFAQATFWTNEEAAPTTLAAVQAFAKELREGDWFPPSISVEQSRAFSEYGVKLRRDGLFGYSKKCARDGCRNDSAADECFGALTPDEAIRGAKKRSHATCGNECWLDAGWGQDQGVNDLLQEWINEPKTHGDAFQALHAAGCLDVDDDGAPQYSLVEDWWQKAKSHEDARQVALDAADQCCDGDYDGDEEAIECEA